MAHFAEINENNIVTRVIVVHNNEITVDDKSYISGIRELEFKGIDFCESLFGHRNWVQTSYNGNIRYNFAGQGFTYDEDNDAFYAPQPYASWSLNQDYKWQPPTPCPADGSIYSWNEETLSWDSI
tara:strand:- start:68 stop:442 length:375 start_codon:yes stop_codon:yes gene_type:complete